MSINQKARRESGIGSGGRFGVWLTRMWLMGVGMAGIGVTAAPSDGGIITLLSQKRSVDVNTNGFPLLLPSDQQAVAPDFGPFDKTVSLSFASVGMAQSASQQSSVTLAADGSGAVFAADGSVFKNIGLNGLSGTSVFDVTFTLSQSEPYTLTYNGHEGDPRPSSPHEFVPGSFSGPSAPGVLAGDPMTTNFQTFLTYQGMLTPGTYELSEQATAAFEVAADASFTVNLAVGTSAVPLPAAFWEALSGVPAVILGAWMLRGGASVAVKAGLAEPQAK